MNDTSGDAKLTSDTTTTHKYTTATTNYLFRNTSWFSESSHVTPPPDILIQPKDLCPAKERLAYLVVVNSATGHFDQRDVIRHTFIQKNVTPSFSHRVVFLLGKAGDELTARKIEKEAEQRGDILQGDFTDTYRNLTFKGVMWLNWVSFNCPRVQWVIKIDDDVVVNMSYVMEHVFREHRDAKHFIGGTLIRANSSRIRRTSDSNKRGHPGKWKVDSSQFRGLEYYPFHYCGGYFVVLTGDLVRPMTAASRSAPFFWIDDIFLFGLLPHIVGDVFFADLDRNIAKVKHG